MRGVWDYGASRQPDKDTSPANAGTSPGGKTMKKTQSPLKSIRAFCVECQGGLFQAVSECTDAACPFHPYRRGKPLAKGKHSPIRACRAYCFKYCLPEAGTKEVRNCGGDTALLGPCPVFPFRMGKNPNISQETRARRSQAALDRGPVGIIATQKSRIQTAFESPESTKTTHADL